MATLEVGYNSSQTLKFEYLDDFGDAVDITGYSMKLICKQSLELADSRAFFDLAGSIITAADGTYKFALTPTETASLPPGTWPAEVRLWSGSTTAPPTKRIRHDILVADVVDLP